MNAKLMNQDQVETMLNHKAPEAMGDAMLDQHTFRQGMANLGAAVNVITTDGGGGSGRLYCIGSMQCDRYTANVVGVFKPLSLCV